MGGNKRNLRSRHDTDEDTVSVKVRIIHPNQKKKCRTSDIMGPVTESGVHDGSAGLVLDVWLLIFSSLNIRDLTRCRAVCRIWHNWCSQNWVWRKNVSRVVNFYGVPRDYFKMFDVEQLRNYDAPGNQIRMDGSCTPPGLWSSFRGLVEIENAQKRAWMSIAILMMTLPYMSIGFVFDEARNICESVYLVAQFTSEFSKSFEGVERIYPRIHPLSEGQLEVTFEFDENPLLPCCAYSVVIRNWRQIFLKGEPAHVTPCDDATIPELQLYSKMLNAAVDMRERLSSK